MTKPKNLGHAGRGRGSLRFSSTPGTFAKIWDVLSLEHMNSKIEEKYFLSGLVINESYEGCSMIVAAHELFRVGYKCILKVGELAPIEAEICWIREIDEDVLRIGFKVVVKEL